MGYKQGINEIKVSWTEAQMMKTWSFIGSLICFQNNKERIDIAEF